MAQQILAADCQTLTLRKTNNSTLVIQQNGATISIAIGRQKHALISCSCTCEKAGRVFKIIAMKSVRTRKVKPQDGTSRISSKMYPQESEDQTFLTGANNSRQKFSTFCKVRDWGNYDLNNALAGG